MKAKKLKETFYFLLLLLLRLLLTLIRFFYPSLSLSVSLYSLHTQTKIAYPEEAGERATREREGEREVNGIHGRRLFPALPPSFLSVPFTHQVFS